MKTTKTILKNLLEQKKSSKEFYLRTLEKISVEIDEIEIALGELK